MNKTRRRRVLAVAATVGLAAVVAVQLYPSDRDHQAAASVQLLTAERSPQTTIHLSSGDANRATTLSELTDRAATQTPFEVVITANAETEGRARALVGEASQRAQAALTTGARATPEILAQAQRDVTNAEGDLAAAQDVLNTVDTSIADSPAGSSAEDLSAQLAQIDRQLETLFDQRDAATTAGQGTGALDAQIAQAQQDQFAVKSAQAQLADLQDRRTEAAAEVQRATAVVDSARGRLTRYQTGTIGSIAVAPIRTETVVSERGFGPDITVVTLVALAATLGVLALATRPRAEVALDLTEPEPAPDPEPEPEPEPRFQPGAASAAEPEPEPPEPEPTAVPEPTAAERAAPDSDMPPRPMRPFTTVKLRSPESR